MKNICTQQIPLTLCIALETSRSLLLDLYVSSLEDIVEELVGLVIGEND